MVHAILVTLVLAQAGATAPTRAPASAPAAAPATGADNLWLVAPLYPGQEILVGRTENAIHQLLPQGSTDLVGFAALQELAKTRKGDLGCALGETTCANPVDAYLRGLGLAKLVLIKGGQEEPNYRYEVTSIDLTSGESRAASGSGPVLEKALLAALVKVAPLASVLHVESTPSGLDLFIDNEKLGKTPYDGQILPGERTLKITGLGYQDLVKTITVPARGKVELKETLQLQPSTLIIKPMQKQAAIYVDGQAAGSGDLSVPVTPGSHTIEARLEGYQTYTKTVTVPPNGQATDVPDLSPTPESGILKKTMYVEIGFQQDILRKHGGTYRVNAVPMNKVNDQDNPPIGALDQGSTGRGFTIDWGQQREHFGLLLLGFTYLGASSDATRGFSGGKSGHFNDANVLSVPATYGDLYDLHFVQPQVNFVAWHIMGYAQAGLGVRALRINTPSFEDIEEQKHSDGFLDVAPYGELKLGLRGYIFEGFYVQASYRFIYVVSVNAPQGAFTSLSPMDGFQAGLGYAF
jgi:hypothetical protein